MFEIQHWFLLPAAALAVVHAAIEVAEDLAGFLEGATGAPRTGWLPLALFTGAVSATAVPLIGAWLIPAAGPALVMLAGGAILADSVITHWGGTLIAKSSAPALGTLVYYAPLGAYLVLSSPASMWWVAPPVLAFVGLWVAFYAWGWLAGRRE